MYVVVVDWAPPDEFLPCRNLQSWLHASMLILVLFGLVFWRSTTGNKFYPLTKGKEKIENMLKLTVIYIFPEQYFTNILQW